MSETANLAGKKLGDYILREKLTSGGMAHIYLGEDEKLQRRAAIKVLTADMAGNDGVLRERFEREARAIAQLEHDSIVPIYQFGQADHLYFIAMRYIEGNDLADEMKKYKERGEKMPVERALSILGQVAAGLDHAHKRGIIHRDVKPSNILLRRQEAGAGNTGDKAVLTDFGLVLWEDVDKTLGTAFGTPRYISPEQATDSQSAVPQSDVYSLAVIVYEIVTNEVLFKGNTPMEVALSHITEPPTPPRAHNPEVPQNAQIEILKALQKDASKRHKTAAEFINALKRAYDIEGTKPNRDEALTDTKEIASRDLAGTKRDSDTTTKDMLDDSWDAIPSAKPSEKKPTSKPKAEKKPSKKAEKAGTATAVLDKKVETKTETAVEKPVVKTTEKTGAGLPLPLPAIAGIVVVVAIIAVVAFNFLGAGSGTGGNPNPPDANMQIYYNENFFAIVNTSENAALNVSNLRIVGDSGETGSGFGGDLAPDACVFLRRNSVSDSDIPSEWGCRGQARTVLSQGNVFWRAETADDTNFAVNDGGNTVSSCRTAGRAVNNAGNNQCGIVWPSYRTNP